MNTETIERAMSAWLKSPVLCGCRFAALTASQKRILLSTTLEPLNDTMVAAINADFDRAAQRKQFALAIFPLVTSESELQSLVATLVRNPRWRAVEFSQDSSHRMVELLWTNPEEVECNAVGFAPTLSMPVSRRAPFVALGVWPCGHDNEHLEHQQKVIGLADTFHGLPKERYKPMLEQTEKSVDEIVGDTFSKNNLRRLSFRVPGSTPP